MESPFVPGLLLLAWCSQGSSMLWLESVLHFLLLLICSNIALYGYNSFIYSSVSRRLDCFLVWAIMKNTAINAHVQVFVWTHIIHCIFYWHLKIKTMWPQKKWKRTLGSEVQKWGCRRTSLVVQWLKLWASTAGGVSSIPGQGSSTCCDVVKKKKKKKNCAWCDKMDLRDVKML